jgi:phosphopantetheine--protein transferase-like protein
MLQGIGIDITALQRFSNTGHREALLENMFDKEEIHAGHSKKEKIRYWAVLFAIKEAVMKAYKTGFHTGSHLHDIHINQDYEVEMRRCFKNSDKHKTRIITSKSSSDKYALGVALTCKQEVP